MQNKGKRKADEAEGGAAGLTSVADGKGDAKRVKEEPALVVQEGTPVISAEGTQGEVSEEEEAMLNV